MIDSRGIHVCLYTGIRNPCVVQVLKLKRFYTLYTRTGKTQKNIFSTTVRSTGTRVLVHQMEV